MSSLDDNDVTGAIYRSNDPIKNFKIRVKLERLTSNALIPSLPRLKIQEDLSRLLGIDEPTSATTTEVARASNLTNPSDYEEVVIGWQQKLFSRSEFETYGRGLGSSPTVLERKYFDQIKEMKRSKRQQPGRIFTYIEDDPYCSERQLDYFVTDSPNEEPSQLALALNSVRRRRGVQSGIRPSNDQYLPKSDLIKQKPTPEDLQINHYGSLPRQTMYIMADLNVPVDTATAQLVTLPHPSDEHVLCRIRVYSNNTIAIEPDFNADKLAYMIENGNLSNEVYQYYLEHASAPISRTDLIKEQNLFHEICSRQQAELAQMVGNEFDTPPPTVLKLNIIGEIISGRNFDYDHIYIYYSLDPAENWYVESFGTLSGYTHTGSTTKSSKHDDIVYYCHPFEFELWYKPPLSATDHEFPQMPKMYFQVASLDTWGRHRTEGYTYLDIPSSPGLYDEHLCCWRPRGDTIFDEVRRFFIGGSIELEELSYVAIPKSFRREQLNNTPLSRFGFRTISTGTVHVRLNVVFQSQSFAMEHRSKRGGHAVNRQGFDAFMSNINDVLGGFERAKERATKVRQAATQMMTTTAF